MPPDEQRAAYADRALPIDCGQTISQPYIVGLMTEALELEGNESVLEVGTGSGYQATILAGLAGRVVSDRAAPFRAANRRGRSAPRAGLHEHPARGGRRHTRLARRCALRPDHRHGRRLASSPGAGRAIGRRGNPSDPHWRCRFANARGVSQARAGEFHGRALSGCRFVPLVGQFEPTPASN